MKSNFLQTTRSRRLTASILYPELIEILNTDEVLDAQGNIPEFSYREDFDNNLYWHRLEEHKNIGAIVARPDAVFSVAPPFSFSEFKKQAQKIHKGSKGKGFYGCAENKTKVSPLYGMDNTTAFIVPAQAEVLIPGDSPFFEVSKEYCLVVYQKDTKELIGNISFTASFYVHDARKKDVDFVSNIHVVWVAPKYRGLGFGLNLGFFCGEIIGEKFIRGTHLLTKSWKISATIGADYECPGGESVVEIAFHALVENVAAEEFSCRISEILLDGAY